MLGNNILIGASGGAGGATGHIIEGSGLFDGSSGYLSRTPGTAGNKQTFTISAIVKRSALTLGGTLHQTIISTGTANNQIRFNTSTDKLEILQSSVVLATTQVFRDPAAWLHIVLAVDTTQATAANRYKLYVNGTQITDFSTASYPSQNTNTGFNNTEAHHIGRSAYDGNRYLNGYGSQVIMIDGYALDPTDFGEVTDNGFWQINKVEETYAIIGADVTGAATDNSVSSSVASTYTFSNQAIGTATSDRVVIVNFGSLKDTAAAYSVTSVTIGGVAATKIHSAQTQTSWGLSSYYATVPTGTTADIVIVHSANMNRCGIQVVTTTNIGELHQVALAEASSGSDPLSFTVDAPAGSLVVGYVYDTGSSSQTWTELTENFDEQISTTHYHSGAIKNYSSAATPTITADPSGSSTTFGIVVVFQPESEGWAFGTNGFLLEGKNVATGVATGGSLSQVTAYTNTDGQGDRTSTITASSNVTPFSGTVNNWVDGGEAQNSSDSIEYTGAISEGDYFRFQFSSNRFIDEITLINTGSESSLGNWKVQGSTDASTWDDLASFVYSNNGGQTISLSNVDAGGYIYYQLIENDTSQTYAGQWYAEIKFKIAETVGAVFTKTGTITATNDSPTNDADNGYGNYATFNPLIPDTNAGTPVYTDGNRHFANASGTGYCGASTLAINSGKFYVEIKPNTFVNDEEIIGFALASSNVWGSTAQLGNASGQGAGLHTLSTSDTKLKIDGGSLTTVDTKMLSPDRTIIAIDSEAGKGWLGFYDNSGSVSRWVDTSGTTRTTDQPAAGTNATWTFTANEAVLVGSSLYGDGNTDIYADSGDWLGTPPSGFVSMGTQNLPTPAPINYEDEYYIEAGISHSNGSTTAVTLPKSVSGGAMVRLKRTDSTGGFYVFDTVRGANKFQFWNDTAVEDSSTFSDQNLTGTTFTIPSGMASGSYLLECFFVGSYFQIDSYTGNGANRTLSFDSTLDTAPGFMVFHDRVDNGMEKLAYHESLGNGKFLQCEAQAVAGTSATFLNSTSPTTTTFRLGTMDNVNKNTSTYIMYAWANSGPYLFGNYTGNGATDGPFINVGGSPKTMWHKITAGAVNDWLMFSSEWSDNVIDEYINPNATTGFSTHTAKKEDIVSNGAKIVGSNATFNTSSGAYIYMAFGIQPLTDGAINQGRAK